eukprot:11326452-Alexandrium_andersonii.AAC.1
MTSRVCTGSAVSTHAPAAAMAASLRVPFLAPVLGGAAAVTDLLVAKMGPSPRFAALMWPR